MGTAANASYSCRCRVGTLKPAWSAELVQTMVWRAAQLISRLQHSLSTLDRAEESAHLLILAAAGNILLTVAQPATLTPVTSSERQGCTANICWRRGLNFVSRVDFSQADVPQQLPQGGAAAAILRDRHPVRQHAAAQAP